jgi:hypothetical protein
MPLLLYLILIIFYKMLRLMKACSPSTLLLVWNAGLINL